MQHHYWNLPSSLLTNWRKPYHRASRRPTAQRAALFRKQHCPTLRSDWASPVFASSYTLAWSSWVLRLFFIPFSAIVNFSTCLLFPPSSVNPSLLFRTLLIFSLSLHHSLRFPFALLDVCLILPYFRWSLFLFDLIILLTSLFSEQSSNQFMVFAASLSLPHFSFSAAAVP